MYDNSFNGLFARRGVICFFLIICLLLSCVVRVTTIVSGPYAAMQTVQSSYRITISRLRGTIFDCNMVPITNNSKKIAAAVSPTPSAIVGISSVLNEEERENIFAQLSQNKPAVCYVQENIEYDGIVCSEVYQHTTSDIAATHLVGYVDSSGHGVSGLEAAYDSLLYSDTNCDAVFTVNGRGDMLYGVQPYIDNDLSVINSGVVTTLDINIQTAVETAALELEKGAVVVCDAKSGKIRAMVSKPTFDVTNIADFLEREDSPLLNRALCAYSVGSVFKPCVAAAALESGTKDYNYICLGKSHIIDRDFNCHKRDGHGALNLGKALAFSCNTFFYNFAINIGPDPIYLTASALGFGNSFNIAQNLKTSSGVLTPLSRLNTDAAVANLSIGQGDLLLSPVSMLTLYCAIASDGCYYVPSVVEKTVKDGRTKDYDIGAKTRVMSKETASTLRQYLCTVINEGTGMEAAPKTCTAAGKTATAQTGRYDKNGIEVTNSWFCGFFPADQPQYVVVVMSEGKPKETTASIFADIADIITQLKGEKSS